ncbi:MAG: proprotein convertase P-domain-containing protein [Vicingaceae bacterium]
MTGLAAGTYSVIIYDAYGCKADAIVIGGIFDADTLFLPDGNGVTYTSQIPISGFGNGAKIDSLSQILQICANMEHSYLGDLELRLTSPSGQICVLKEQNGGGSCDLGEPYASGPVDGANSNLIDPGVGYEYCWNSTPTYVTMVGESNNFSHTIPSSTGGTYTDNFLPPGSYQSFDPLNNLLGSTMDGNWTLEITDQFGLDNGYVFNWNISLVGGAPDTLVVINQPDSILVNGSITQAQCGGNDGAIDITVSGANSPFTFLWSNGSTDEDISGLTADNYTVIVSDITGCSDTTTFSLNNISSINIVSSVTDVSCVGGNNGDITVTTSGGTPHYIFSWSNGASDEDISGLTAGTYTLSIEDALGCEFSESITVGTLPAISISLNNTSNEFCGQANGSIDINVTGGSGSYGFSWDNGAISEDISSLAAGTYIITVTDGNNCSANATFTITNNTGTLAASASVSSEICGNSGGAINLIPTGNAGILTFLWSNGATSEDLNNIPAGLYSCTITDANGCVLVSPQYNVINESSTLLLTNTVINNENCGNGQGSIDITIQGGSIPIDFAWDNGDITEDITGLSAGTFSCTITDGNGCQVQTGTLNLFNTPGNLNVTTDLVTNEICNNGAGAINVTTTGGTNPIIYSWDNGSTSEDISGLIAGTYNLTVTDFNGCVFNHSETVTNTSGTLQIDNAVLTDENCNDGTGSIDLIISGDAPFIFNWDNGQTIEDISGLSAGNYFVTVSDANGCEVSQSYTINNNTGNLSVSSIGTAEFCSNSNGSIDITVNGGTMPYNFLWSNGSTDEDLTGISSGIYTCTITDDLGCSVLTSNISISNNPGTLSFIDSTQNESCGNGAGAIELFVSGGTPGYTFTWSPNVSNNAIATNLSAVGLDISKALHNSVMVYFPVLHSQINSIFCSIVVVSFQGIIICFLFQITP